MSKLRFDMSMMDVLVEFSEGNPGALTVLMELLQHYKDDPEFLITLMFLDNNEIYGSKLYMLWNDCCNRDINKTIETIKYLKDNNISKETIHKNLDRGRALPFEEFLKTTNNDSDSDSGIFVW